MAKNGKGKDDKSSKRKVKEAVEEEDAYQLTEENLLKFDEQNADEVFLKNDVKDVKPPTDPKNDLNETVSVKLSDGSV